MNKNREYYFENYFNNNLSVEEKDWFNKEYLLNNEFKKEYDLYLDCIELIRDKKLLEFSQIISDIGLSKKRKPKRLMLLTTISVAASILFILCLFNYNFDSNKTVFSNNYMISLTKDDSSSELINASIEFNNKNYKSAIRKFEKIYFKNETNYCVTFYLAQSYLKNKNYDEAEELFNKIITNNDNYFVEQSEWYLGILFYETERFDELKVLLTTIIGKNNSLKKDAEKALKQLGDL